MADMRTPLRKARGLGAARSGTGLFWQQRLTAVANVPLIVFFIILLIVVSGQSYAEVRQTLSSPFYALVMMLVIVSALYHMRIGMQEIIEDYVHADLAKVALLMLNNFFAVIVGVVSIVALIKMVLGG